MFEPRDLPIYAHERELLAAIADHRVIVVEGPTGSGKTTQLPKILHAAGLAEGRIIGVTQPRRIAAVSVAWRIAEELDVEVGSTVGYAIRFDDRTGPDTVIKIMTDGILLQEARTDPLFSRYGIIVVDEAHERTLNIDFTLGLLHRALSRRDDLKVIISSATIKPETFQRYFEGVAGEVPFVSIDARPYPVEKIHRPPRSDGDEALVDSIADEVRRIDKSGEEGAILVFLSGEKLIKDTAEKLRPGKLGKRLAIQMLYGKLTREEQELIFKPIGAGLRRVVLSTNIAETSITVPDVRFVIDSGLAKIPRVHSGTGIMTLREEGISKASAEQRAGRAGRTAPGAAIRLFSKHSLQNRPEFTDEEILRLDLTDVCLRLIHLGIQDIERFPLPTVPPRKAIRAAIAQLEDMGAIDAHRQLTSIGERMMPFPLSPSLARMVIEAADRYPNAVDEVLMVGSFLSSRPPYLFPQGEENEARAAQRGLAHPLGDATTAVVTMRRYLKAKNPERFCKEWYLDPNIMAFIAKAHRQLTDIAESGGIEVKSGGDAVDVVRCVATGFAHNILRAKGRLYEGLGDLKIALHPASALWGERAQYIVAAEIVVSSRAFARNASMLRPEWVAELNPARAAAWKLHVKKKKKESRKDVTREPPAESLRIGTTDVDVTIRKGRPFVLIDVSQAAALMDADVGSLPPDTLKWKTELVTGKHKVGQAQSLINVLCMLPHMPLPDGPPTRLGGVPLGAFLEIDRNLHTISQHIDKVLSVGLPHKGKWAGWLMFVANGEGGYWFEVGGDFPDVVRTTLGAIADLLVLLPSSDPLADRLVALASRITGIEHEIDYALAGAKRMIKASRQRHDR